jgi:adenylate kinase
MSGKARRNVILLGPPGAGKGTQAKLVADSTNLRHISSGDLFRHHLSQGTPLGKKANEFMSKGLLVPDDVTISMVLEEMEKTGSAAGLMLDGFPRNLTQAQRLDDALNQKGQAIDLALLMKVPTEELVKRLSGRLVCRQCKATYNAATAPSKKPGVCDACGGQLVQRDDDKPEAVRTRLKVYESETKPLVDYYRRQDKLAEVDATGSVDEVKQRLLRTLDSSRKAQSRAR